MLFTSSAIAKLGLRAIFSWIAFPFPRTCGNPRWKMLLGREWVDISSWHWASPFSVVGRTTLPPTVALLSCGRRWTQTGTVRSDLLIAIEPDFH